MKPNLQFIIIILALLFNQCNCKDPLKAPEDTLPPITSEGKGTLGCLVNGKVWLPNGYKGKATCEYYTWNRNPQLYGHLTIKGYRDNKDILILGYDSIFSIGSYTLPHYYPSGWGGGSL